MKSEVISLDTAQKLVNREKAVKYCQNILKREVPLQVKSCVRNILKLLEIEKENLYVKNNDNYGSSNMCN